MCMCDVTSVHAGMGDPSGKGIAMSYLKNMKRLGKDPVNRILGKQDGAASIMALSRTSASSPTSVYVPYCGSACVRRCGYRTAKGSFCTC